MLGMGILYSVNATYLIIRVATGAEPIQTLIGLPIGLLFIWAFFRAARNIRVP